mgnify:CR=1 FL=1
MVVKDANFKSTTILKQLANDNGGIILAKATEKAGVSRAMLSYLVKQGALERIAQGQYVFSSEIPDEMLSLSQRSENIIFSHESALYLHGISGRTPFEHSITVPDNKRPSVQIKKTCKIYYIKSDFFDLGRTERKSIHGNLVPCYDAERTICDIIRSRSRIDEETFLDGIKMYASLKNKDLGKLGSYADKLRILQKVRDLIGVLV